MDPLSLTASILAVVGAGAQTIKLLKKVASYQDSPSVALALDNELSDLRQSVQAIEDLLSGRSEDFDASDIQDAARRSNTMAVVIRCLESGKEVVIKLESVLDPLLKLSLRPDVLWPKKWISWVKEDKKLKDFREELHRVRVGLNTALGMLNLCTSIRMKTISDTLSTGMTKLQENQELRARSHTQEILELKTFTEQQTSKILQHRPRQIWGQGQHDCVIATQGHNHGSFAREASLHLQRQGPKCNSCSYQRYPKRSPHGVNRILGTLFVGSSGLPHSTSLCRNWNYARSCTGSHIVFSLAYFFPIWFLSCAILLVIQDHPSGFDFNLRVLRYVSYSSPMFQCAYQGDSLGMKNLLKRRLESPFDVTSGPQRSLLGVAASRGHGEICKILLYEGADPFLTDYRNRSAIDIAWKAALIDKKSASDLTSLLAFSSYEDYIKKFKLSLVHKSVLGIHHHDVVQLLEQSPDCAIDEEDAFGQTPLYWAALRADLPAVSHLLRAGADASIRNHRGAGILTAALMSRNASCARMILETANNVNYTDADGYTPLHHSCRYIFDIEIVKALLDRGADKNATTALGHSPLMIASYNKRSSIAKLLLDRQVDVNLQGKDGGCALHHAIMVGAHDVVRHLLESRANHRITTNANETILHFVAQRNGDRQMIRILELFNLEGINVEAKSQPLGLTALQAAERHHDCDSCWLEEFKVLMLNIRLGGCCQKYKTVGSASISV